MDYLLWRSEGKQPCSIVVISLELGASIVMEEKKGEWKGKKALPAGLQGILKCLSHSNVLELIQRKELGERPKGQLRIVCKTGALVSQWRILISWILFSTFLNLSVQSGHGRKTFSSLSKQEIGHNTKFVDLNIYSSGGTVLFIWNRQWLCCKVRALC